MPPPQLCAVQWPEQPLFSGGPSGTDWVVRPYRESDEPSVLELLRAVYGQWPHGLPDESPAAGFRWKFVDSPFGPSRLIVGECDEAIIGFRAMLPWSFDAGGRTLRAMRGVDVAVERKHRGRGVGAALIAATLTLSPAGTSLTFGNPNAMSAAVTARLGWRQVGPFRTMIQLRRPLKVIRNKLAHRSGPATAALPDVAAEPAADALRDAERVTAVLGHADERDDRLSTHRTLNYLRWRYGTVGDYRAVDVQDRDQHGIVIFCVKQAGGLTFLAICELLVTGGNQRLARRLLRQAARTAAVDYVCCLFPRRSPGHQAAVQSGYVPSRHARSIVVHPLDPALPLDLSDRDSWALTYGDLDLL